MDGIEVIPRRAIRLIFTILLGKISKMRAIINKKIIKPMFLQQSDGRGINEILFFEHLRLKL